MNENIPQNNYYDRRTTRRQHRLDRRGSSWIGGLILLGLGILLLMQNTGTISVGRWWSLLILIPAIAAFSNAWKEYQVTKNLLTGRAIGALIAGVLLSAITAAFLFNLDWGWFGPALLLIIGIGVLIRAFSH